MSEETKGTILSLFGASCWGVSGCIGQYLFEYEGLESTWLAPVRLGLAGIILLIWFLLTNREQLFGIWKDPLNARDLLIYGLAGVSFCQITYLLTIELSSASTATILQATAPAMILIYMCITERRAPTLFELAAELIALVGVYLLSTHGDIRNMAISTEALVIGLASALGVVMYTLSPRRLQESYPTPLLQCWAFLLGGILFSLIFRPWVNIPAPTPGTLLGILGVVVVGNIVGYSCYLAGAKRVGPQKASLISFAEPVVAAIISTTLLGSPFTAWDAAGFVCLFIMLVLIVIPGTKNREESSSSS